MVATLESHAAPDVRDWITRLCVELDVSPTVMARRAGLTPSTINRFLRARDAGNLSAATIDALERTASSIALDLAGIAHPDNNGPRLELFGLAQRIKCARLRMGLGQTEFAALIGCGQSTVSKWERGTLAPDITTILRIATATKMDAGALAFGLSEEVGEASAMVPAASLTQDSIDVRRPPSPRTIEIAQGDAVITILDYFVDDLITALQRVRDRKSSMPSSER